MPDAFDTLADVLLKHVGRAASAAAPRHSRYKVVKLDPLTFKPLTGSLTFDEEDDDVEVYAAVLKARDDDDLAKGDVVEGREDDDGWVITGVVG